MCTIRNPIACNTADINSCTSRTHISRETTTGPPAASSIKLSASTDRSVATQLKRLGHFDNGLRFNDNSKNWKQTLLIQPLESKCRLAVQRECHACSHHNRQCRMLQRTPKPLQYAFAVAVKLRCSSTDSLCCPRDLYRTVLCGDEAKADE